MGATLGKALLGAKNSMNATKTFLIFAMVIHFIVNLTFGLIVNAKDNNTATKKGALIAHTTTSGVLFIILFFIKITGWFPVIGLALKQDLIKEGFIFITIPMAVHLVVSWVFFGISLGEEDDTKLITLSNIFNGISTAACIVISVFLGKKYETLKEMSEGVKKKEVKEAAGENQLEAAAPGKDAGPAATGLNDASGINDTKEKIAKEFGKRQRRRNPPKRRKKKY